MTADIFPFRPSTRRLPLLAIGLGAIMVAAGFLPPAADARPFLFGAGIAGIVLGLLYLASPAWRLQVEVSENELRVMRKGEERLALPWAAIKEVLAVASSKVCFVDGGEPQKSLLVPGAGAPAPYRIERGAVLYDLILQKVPADRIRYVDELAPNP